MDSQMAMKILTHTQTLLRPKNLDPRIITDLDLDPLYTCVEMAPVNAHDETHDLIDDLL